MTSTSTTEKKDNMNQKTDNILDNDTAPEIKSQSGLLAKNRVLLQKVAALNVELEAARTAQASAQASEAQWRTKWHESAVVAPFEALLATATNLPAKYLREALIERGIVKMLADDDGIERPAWHDAKGEAMAAPADPWRYLVDLKDTGLNHILRSHGASGSGAAGSSYYYSSGSRPAAKPTPPAAPKPPAFGLR